MNMAANMPGTGTLDKHTSTPQAWPTSFSYCVCKVPAALSMGSCTLVGTPTTYTVYVKGLLDICCKGTNYEEVYTVWVL